MRVTSALKYLALAFVLAFTFAGVAQVAQADNLYATIRGQVLDQTKAAIPGAQVTATNTGTNVARTVTSQADGSYEFINLVVGTYNLTVTKDGFQTYVATGISLVVNQIYVLNPTLQVGAKSTTVTVEAAKVQVETTSMQLGSTIEAPTIVDMPLNGRNWVQLQQLQTGVVASSDRFGSNYATNGSQSQQNSYLINGTDANDLPLNSPLIQPSPDAIAEFRMVTNTINPEYGRNSGAILDAVIKSGTNKFHGDAFDFYRDTFLNNRNAFQLTRPIFHQHQYGGTIGGPVWKDHTFFFFSYQGTKNATPQNGGNVKVFTIGPTGQLGGVFGATGHFDTVLPATVIQPGQPGFVDPRKVSPIPLFGDSSSTCQVGGTPCAAATPYGRLVDPSGAVLLSNALFTTGTIPTQDFNSISNALVAAFVPAPNCNVNRFCFNPSQTNNTKQYVYQINENAGQHDTLWFYGFQQPSNTSQVLPFTGASLPGFPQINTSNEKQFTGAWNHIFSANTLNEFRIGYTRLNFVAVLPAAPVLPSSFGFDINPQNSVDAGVPRISISGGYFGLGFSNNGPQPRIDQTKQVTDNFSQIFGKHTLKFGAEFRDFWVTNPFFFNNNGNFGFGLSSSAFGTKDGAADFLLGFPRQYSQSGGGFIDARAKEFYGYAQDEFKFRSDLTLTFGMGYQIDTPLKDIFNNGVAINCFIAGQQSTQFSTAPVGLNFPGDPGCSSAGYVTHYGDFAPRLGFAWAPQSSAPFLSKLTGSQGKFSLRGGVGMYYNRSEEEQTLQNLLAPPFALLDSGIGDVNGVASFKAPFTDIRCVDQNGAAITGTSCTSLANPSIPNKYPFTPPKPGASVDFSFFEPFSLNLLDPATRIPTAYNYNLTAQREIPGQVIVSIGYVGATARHLESTHELNPLHNSLACAADVTGTPFLGCGTVGGIQPLATETIDPTTVSSGTPLACGPSPGDGRPCMTVGQDLFYYPIADASIFPSLAMQSTMGNSYYNSLQVSANKALSHGLTFLASYTWSHSTDLGSSFEDSGFNGYAVNPFNFRSFYGDSRFDARHRFVFSYDYALGSLSHVAGFHWMPSRIGGGWHVAGITTLQTGFPVTVLDTGFTSLQCNEFEFYSCWDRPDAVSKPIITNPRTNGNIWFNASAFALAAPGTVGNAGRNNFHGPGINNWDMAFMKDTRFTESTSLQLRMDFFNLMNHTQFNGPDGDIQSSFGLITSAAGGRVMQLAAKFFF
jgi:hypothetical protein